MPQSENISTSGIFPDATYPTCLKRTSSRNSRVQYSYSTKSRVITQARTKLYHEASKNDIDLRLLVCHANLLDYLVADLSKGDETSMDSDTTSPNNYTLSLPPTYESDESDEDEEDDETYYDDDDDEHLISKDDDVSSKDAYSYYDYSDEECDSESEEQQDDSQSNQAFLDKCDQYFRNNFNKLESKSRDVDIDCHADDENASSDDDDDYDSDSDSYYNNNKSSISDDDEIKDELDTGDLGLHRCGSRSTHDSSWAPQVTVVDVCDSESESESEEVSGNDKVQVAVLHDLSKEIMVGYNNNNNQQKVGHGVEEESDSWGMSSYENTVKSEIRRTIELMDRLHQSRRQNRATEDFNNTPLPGLIKTDFSTSEEDSDDSDPLVTPTSSSEVSDDNSSPSSMILPPAKLVVSKGLASFHYDIDESNTTAGADNTSWSQVEV